MGDDDGGGVVLLGTVKLGMMTMGIFFSNIFACFIGLVAWCSNRNNKWGRRQTDCGMQFTNESVQRAYLATEENPYDLDAWNILLRELQTRRIEDVRALFEKLVKIFPTTGRFWKIYIEQEVRSLICSFDVLFTWE